MDLQLDTLWIGICSDFYLIFADTFWIKQWNKWHHNIFRLTILCTVQSDIDRSGKIRNYFWKKHPLGQKIQSDKKSIWKKKSIWTKNTFEPKIQSDKKSIWKMSEIVDNIQMKWNEVFWWVGKSLIMSMGIENIAAIHIDFISRQFLKLYRVHQMHQVHMAVITQRVHSFYKSTFALLIIQKMNESILLWKSRSFWKVCSYPCWMVFCTCALLKYLYQLHYTVCLCCWFISWDSYERLGYSCCEKRHSFACFGEWSVLRSYSI